MNGTRTLGEETILIVEDDKNLRFSLSLALKAEGYRVLLAEDGEAGLQMTEIERPDLVLLDVMLPVRNGFEVLKEIRARDARLPVLLVTAKGEEEDRVRGLRLGGDDYIVKPFGLAELVARVGAALRRVRVHRPAQTALAFSDVSIDYEAHEVRRGSELVATTTLELKLLRHFLEREGRVLSRQGILDAVWGADYFGTERTVDNFVTRLRAKLEPDPEAPRHFRTVRGAGYRFVRDPRE